MKHVFARCSERQHQGGCTALPRWRMMPTILAFAALFSATLAVGAAHAVPIETFTLNQSAVAGVPSSGAGTVTIMQINMNEVQVTVSLAPNLLINTGGPHTPGPHTPFAFNLTQAATTSVNSTSGITVLAPVTLADCSPAPAPCFTPTYASGDATPYGTLSEALNYSGSNGGLGHGNVGPLIFTVTGAGVGDVTPSGSFSAFAPNSAGATFAADLYVSASGQTGTVAAFAGTPGDSGGTSGGNSGGEVPEPTSLMLLGSGLLGLGVLRRRFARR